MFSFASARPRRVLPRWPRRLAYAAGLWLAMSTCQAPAEIQVSMNDDNTPQYEFGSGQRLFTPLGGIMRAEYRGGDRAAGQQDGFTRLGLFRPDYIGEYFVFVDGALSLTDNGAVGGNLGTGMRRMSDAGDSFWGVNAWYDNSNVYTNPVHQVGVGFEYVREKFDFRANAYQPLDSVQQAPGTTLLSPPTFEGNRILLDTLVPLEVAMRGFDLEAGMITPPAMGIHHIRIAAGYYHYEEANTQNINGVRAKLEGFLTPSVAAGITVQNDAVFDTSVTFQVIWTPGVDDPMLTAAPMEHDVESRIAQLAKRQYQPVVARETARVMEFARHADGELIYVSHADSAGSDGGGATFENPINHIGLAADMAPERAIVYAHGNSVFEEQGVVLKANQRLLGEGIDHIVDTFQVGEVLLPAVNGGSTPIIRDSDATAITLASGTEVSNFMIQDSGDTALLANEVSGTVNVNHVDIEGGFTGIQISESTGDFTFTDTTITDVFFDSFSIDGGSANILYTGDITNNVEFSGAIIRISNTLDGNIEFSGGMLSDNMGDGIDITGSNANVLIENFSSRRGNFTGIGMLFNSGNYVFRNIMIDRPLLGGIDLFLNEEATIQFTDIDVTTMNAPSVGGSINGTLIIDGDSRLVSNGDAVLDLFEMTVDIELTEIESNSPIISGLNLFDLRGGIKINGGSITNAGIDGVFANNVERLEMRDVSILGAGFSGLNISVSDDFRSDVTLDNISNFGTFNPSQFGFQGANNSQLYLNITNVEDIRGFEFTLDPDGTIFFAGPNGQGMSFPNTNGNLEANGNTTLFMAPVEIISGSGNEIQIVAPSEVLLPE